MCGPRFLMVPATPVQSGFLRLYWSYLEDQSLFVAPDPEASGANSGARVRTAKNNGRSLGYSGLVSGRTGSTEFDP
jgi:hypothetical protein